MPMKFTGYFNQNYYELFFLKFIQFLFRKTLFNRTLARINDQNEKYNNGTETYYKKINCFADWVS